MSPPRRVEPEWLDHLPAGHPRAMRSRRDLKRVNAFMLQTGLMARALIAHCGRERPRTILDIGSGDGTFMLGIARRLASRWPNVTVILLDRQDIVGADTRAAFGALRWQVEPVAADIFTFLDRMPPANVDIVTANLVLHHFDEPRLSKLLAQVAQRAPLFVACEPRRGRFGLLCSRLLWAIGCNDVTRHDAAASVRAGFDGKELSGLWPAREPWNLHEQAAGLFTHCFVAGRAIGHAA